MPGSSEPPGADEMETYEELEYAAELMLVQFFGLVRSALQGKKKGGD